MADIIPQDMTLDLVKDALEQIKWDDDLIRRDYFSMVIDFYKDDHNAKTVNTLTNKSVGHLDRIINTRIKNLDSRVIVKSFIETENITFSFILFRS